MIEERVPFAREGIPFIGIAGFLALISSICEAYVLTILFSLLTLFCLYFFRDPERSFTSQPGAVISPADGKVVSLHTSHSSKCGGEECYKLSIFMSPFDVHVNRVPVNCVVTGSEYLPGRYLAADKEAASQENERNVLLLQTETGQELVLTQVAGFIARRIVCRARVGDRLKQGERFGLIRLGSRVDLLLPVDFVPSVKIGSKVRAGQTILGILP